MADSPSLPGRAPVPPAWKLMTLNGLASTVSAGSPSARPGPPSANRFHRHERALGRHAAAQRLVQAAEHHVGQHLAGDVAGRDRRGMLGIEDEPSGAVTRITDSEPSLFGTLGATMHFTPNEA